MEVIMFIPRFADRVEAGRELATALREHRSDPDVMVLGLPRGGLPVAWEVAHSLNLPLDVFLVRKLGVPGHEELAMGAIASGGVRVLNEPVIAALQVSERSVEAVAVKEQEELDRREKEYRRGRPPIEVRDRTVILVDDGLATGSTMEAAVQALGSLDPARLVVAVPVGASETCDRLARLVDELVCLDMPEPFRAVGMWYEEFDQTTDEEVRTLLERPTVTGHDDSESPAGS
jgi:putative phosphoribosyl transferase